MTAPTAGRLRQPSAAEREHLARAVHLLCTDPDHGFQGFRGLPFLKPAFASLVVFVDEGCATAYTDCRWRVGVGPAQLDPERTPVERLAFLLAHECLHNTQRHATRFEACPETDRRRLNVAADLEINAMLAAGVLGIDASRAPTQGPGASNGRWDWMPGGVVVGPDGREASAGCLPGSGPFADMPLRETMEAYLALLPDEEGAPDDGPQAGDEGAEDREGPRGAEAQGPSDGGGGAWAPDVRGLTDPVWQRAEAIGAAPISVAEEAEVRDQMRHAVEECRRKGSWGSRAMGALLDALVSQAGPPRVDWRRVLGSVVAKAGAEVAAGRSDYSYRRRNRRRSGSEFVFPGLHTYRPRVAVALDTSESMGAGDYAAAAAEIEGIIKRVAGRVAFLSIDTEASEPRQVSSFREAFSHLEGGGGTDMGPAVRAAASWRADRRPDLLVVISDGWFDWDGLARACGEREARRMAVVVCVTAPGHHARAKEAALRRANPYCRVVDCS